MFGRDTYLQKLISFQDTAELIKVITGVRRCGKSSLLELFYGHLLSRGVKDRSILRINLEDMAWREIDSAPALHDYVKKNRAKRGKTYVLLDEVQKIDQWERAVNSLRLDRGLDVYITGSNTYMLNSSLSTLLSGRYVEIKMFPLSFAEFLVFAGVAEGENKTPWFEQYLIQGGFPGLFSFNRETPLVREYLSGIYNTVVMKDIITMNQIRDVDILEKIILFLADNIGYLVSAKKIADYLTSTGRKISSYTVDNYIKTLENAYFFYRARRCDIKGKNLLSTNDKFFIVDPGLRRFLKGTQSDYGSVLENIVYFELLRRGYTVAVGKFDSLEIDFVAWNDAEKVYYQVTTTMAPPEVRERELLPLKKIRDNYKKVILSLDPPGPFTDINGISHYNLIDFLLEGDREFRSRN
ncbi:MAG: ATP-binding protein [Spirochaetaceae bacterium]|jgi:predicted AAA+ superfamily ATPase|nr:ATP-binding protein [Spirochaetaceae bacterium]